MSHAQPEGAYFLIVAIFFESEDDMLPIGTAVFPPGGSWCGADNRTIFVAYDFRSRRIRNDFRRSIMGAASAEGEKRKQKSNCDFDFMHLRWLRLLMERVV